MCIAMNLPALRLALNGPSMSCTSNLSMHDSIVLTDGLRQKVSAKNLALAAGDFALNKPASVVSCVQSTSCFNRGCTEPGTLTRFKGDCPAVTRLAVDAISPGCPLHAKPAYRTGRPRQSGTNLERLGLGSPPAERD